MTMNVSVAESNVQGFARTMSVLHRSGCGLFLIKTREPLRCLSELRVFATSQNLKFKNWTVLRGWITPPVTEDAQPTNDGRADIMQALLTMTEKSGQADDPFDNTLGVMMYPQKWINTHAGVIQCLKEYSRDFGEVRKRLVLIVPPDFTPAIELQDDLQIIDFLPPGAAELREIYDDLMAVRADRSKALPKFDDDDISAVLNAGLGLTCSEFENAVARSMVIHSGDLGKVTVEEFTKVILDSKTEAVKRSEVLEVMPSEDMANVGGLENLKAWLGKRRAAFTPEAREAGIDPLKGYLLVGPPGTGKSLAAKATANELALPLIRFDIGRVFNSLVGSSEARIRAALQLVDAMAPCVLLVDEVDKAFDQRSGGGDSGVGRRILGAFLTWLQENKNPVFVVMTANDVGGLPAELIRKGRLDEIFAVGLPNEEARTEILRIHLAKRGYKAKEVSGLTDVVESTAGYVPAELESAVKDAIIEAFDAEKALNGKMILSAARAMTPLSVAMEDKFASMADWAAKNARPAGRSDEQNKAATRGISKSMVGTKGRESRRRAVDDDFTS